MDNKAERLKSLETEKLIDVVKNYRQYDYNIDLRNKAIEILKDRGIDNEFLRLTGNLENSTYTHAEYLYNSFMRRSKVAFTMYCIIIANIILITLIRHISLELTLFFAILNLFAMILYLIYLFKSMFDQIQFNKVVGRHVSSEGPWLYIAVGMPLYMFSYFYFKNQMKERMRMIN